MSDFYTADLHLGHEKVAKLRGFDSPLLHDLVVLSNLSKRLRKGDRLWVLGDVSVETYPIEVLSMKEVELHLISGNHDAVHPLHRRSEQAQQEFRKAFDSIDSMGTFRHNKQKIMLSHFPYGGDHTELERYPEYRLRDLGAPIVHGHTHSEHKVSYSPCGTLQVCVSLDAWNLKPVSKEDLTKIIDQNKKEKP